MESDLVPALGAQNHFPRVHKSWFSSQLWLHHQLSARGLFSFALHLYLLSHILVSFQLYLKTVLEQIKNPKLIHEDLQHFN